MVQIIIQEQLQLTTVNGEFITVNGTLFSGNKFEVTQYNHAHHGVNQVEIKKCKTRYN